MLTYKMTVIFRLLGLIVSMVVGYWLVFFAIAYITQIFPTTPPNPFRIGACLADQYSISCTGAVLKTDLEVPVLFKDQERLPQ